MQAPLQLKKVDIDELDSLPDGYVGLVAGENGQYYVKNENNAPQVLLDQTSVDEGFAVAFGGTATSTYTNGRLTARTYADGSSKTYTYNEAGRLTVTVHTLSNGSTVTLTRTYNADGTLVTIIQS